MNAVRDTSVRRFLAKIDPQKTNFVAPQQPLRPTLADHPSGQQVFVRKLITKLLPPGNGQVFAVDDQAALRFNEDGAALSMLVAKRAIRYEFRRNREGLQPCQLLFISRTNTE